MTHPASIRAIAIRMATLATISASLGGCAAPVLDRPLAASDASGEHQVAATLSHGYALLFDLLDDEAKVAGILAIKSPRPGVADLLRHISMEADVDREHLRPLLAESPTIALDETSLPLLERDARRRIAREETPALLFAGGRSFETRMLLTQQKAAQYAAALCESLAAADPNRSRGDLLTVMAHHWHGLEGEIRSWLTVVETPPMPASDTGGPDAADPE